MIKKSNSTIFLSVVVPSYNELKNLQRGVLDELTKYLDLQSYTWEIILSDDGSTDGTLSELEQFATKHQSVRVVHNPHQGKAATVKSGMLEAKGEWRLFTDFDQSTPIAEIAKLLAYAKQGYEVVIGSREAMGARRDSEPFYRHLMGRVFNLVVQIFTVPGLLDTQCGFKLFSAKATQALFPKLYIYGDQARFKDAFTGAFDVELLYLAFKHGFEIREVPIIWAHHETDRVNPIKDSLRMFRDILRIRVAWALGKYAQ